MSVPNGFERHGYLALSFACAIDAINGQFYAAFHSNSGKDRPIDPFIFEENSKIAVGRRRTVGLKGALKMPPCTADLPTRCCSTMSIFVTEIEIEIDKTSSTMFEIEIEIVKGCSMMSISNTISIVDYRD
jgi:hypothetical protein